MKIRFHHFFYVERLSDGRLSFLSGVNGLVHVSSYTPRSDSYAYVYEFPTLCRNAAGMVPTVYCTTAAVPHSSEVTVNTTVRRYIHTSMSDIRYDTVLRTRQSVSDIRR